MTSTEYSDAGVDLPDVSGSDTCRRPSAADPNDTAAGGSRPIATDGGLDADVAGQNLHASARAGGQPAIAM